MSERITEQMTSEVCAICDKCDNCDACAEGGGMEVKRRLCPSNSDCFNRIWTAVGELRSIEARDLY